MKFLTKMKDGGPTSNVTGYFLCEIKPLFSIALLRFEGRSRTNYHSHAFHALTWFIKGSMLEMFPGQIIPRRYKRSLRPKLTKRGDVHKVNSDGVSWVFTIRGPWKALWKEINPTTGEFITLTHGREEVKREKHEHFKKEYS